MNEHRNCTCPASKSGSFQIATDHYSRNFIPTGWKLEYTSLEQHEPQRFLYMTGWCLRCGGQDLQSGISIPDELSGDALLERIYREMEHYRPFEHRRSDGIPPSKPPVRGGSSPPMRPLRNLSVRWLETWMSCWKKPVEKKGR